MIFYSHEFDCIHTHTGKLLFEKGVLSFQLSMFQSLNIESSNSEDSELKSETQPFHNINSSNSEESESKSETKPFHNSIVDNLHPGSTKSFTASVKEVDPESVPVALSPLKPKKPDLDEDKRSTSEPAPPSTLEKLREFMSSLPLFDLSNTRTKRGW